MKRVRAGQILAAFVVSSVITLLPLRGMAQDADGDPGAEAFMKHCMRCHEGILTGNDLQNTVLSTPASLEKTVRRMEAQHTAPLTEKQVADLVELLHDREVRFRLEEAELMQDVPETVASGTDAKGAAPDIDAQYFMKNCASCHTVGGTGSFGGDLAATSGWAVERLRGDVSRMQARVGPMSAEQIDGLVELLKAPDRDARLAAAGYKAPTVTPPVPQKSPQEKATDVAKARADAVRQKLESTGGAKAHEPQRPPMVPLVGSLVVAFLLGFGFYAIAKKADG